MTPGSPLKAASSVHSIDHFALNVPDLDLAWKFVTAFGLRASRTDESIELRTAGSDHRWARLFPSDAKSLAYLSFNCHETDFPAILTQLEACGAVAGFISFSQAHRAGSGPVRPRRIAHTA